MDFSYEELLQLSEDTTEYRKLTDDYISESEFEGQKILKISKEGLTFLMEHAFYDASFKLRTSHLEKVAAILEDPEASDNDKFVASNMLENSAIAIHGLLPTCQDTGTATVYGIKGQRVWTDANDAKHISHGIFNCFQKNNLRYSQVVPLDMFTEQNSGTNLPAQIDLHAEKGSTYKFLCMAKGGGSANKSYLYQQTKSLLNEKSFEAFILEAIKGLGTAACPPYHLAFVVGGSSADTTMKMVKLASAGYLDNLPTSGSEKGRAFRDTEWEHKITEMCYKLGIGAQFGGKYFVHDVKVIRMHRHAASCPVGVAVSCSADRNIKAKITRDGIFLEKMEEQPGRLLKGTQFTMKPPVEIDLDKPMVEILEELSKHPVKTRLSLSGTMIVARDSAHAKLKELLDSGKELPDYFKNHPVYYAGPAKTPEGMATGSFGPTTANRMDPYVDAFQKAGGSMIMVAKGNRSLQVTDACKENGGFYLGSIGGPAAILAQNNILEVDTIDFEELGMEAVRKIKIKDFPAFIIVDDKGNDFFATI
ncbi:MAG: FumA C-terminus/TtdB family hydratase beta subunit [Fibrobacterales bacterium]